MHEGFFSNLYRDRMLQWFAFSEIFDNSQSDCVESHFRDFKIHDKYDHVCTVLIIW
jgi:hypothetical protein